ncbi:hypothetical protein VI817_001089 [Penicillium citrinum]|nr:hypothetical protein VI817_001089 [Penicillium citrinum]
MSPNHENEADEDDYMSMIIEEPKQKETFSQKKRREQREVSSPSSPLLVPLLTSAPPLHPLVTRIDDHPTNP